MLTKRERVVKRMKRYGIVIMALLTIVGCTGVQSENDNPSPATETAEQNEPLTVPVAPESPVAGLFIPDQADATAAQLVSRGAEAVPLLSTALRGGAGNYQGMGYIKIVEVLGRIGDAGATPALLAVAVDQQAQHYPRILPWVVVALGQVGDQSCVSQLEQLLNNPGIAAETRALAAASLKQITGNTYSINAEPFENGNG